jgi:indole-3-glycerol phosphate synthase
MSDEGKTSEVANSIARRFKGVRRCGGILDRIVEVKARTLAERVKVTNFSSKSDFTQALAEQTPGAVFENALGRSRKINVIAEIKRKSPSKGVLREDFRPLSIAESYSRADAAALSVLTEEEFFAGSLDYLFRIRRHLPQAPLLRKDFIFDLSQIDESKAAGASALLLIVAILEDELLADLLSATHEAGLAALVEVHDEGEMERAALAGAGIIGVNNRDLKDFSVSLETSIRLSKMAPPDSILVSESGINTPEDIARLTTAGFSAFLVGEHFMRAPDPGLELTKLVAGAETIVFGG